MLKLLFKAVVASAAAAFFCVGCDDSNTVLSPLCADGISSKCGPDDGDGGNPSVTKGTFLDSRDGKVYKKVTIGGKTWMAENLNYDIPNVTTDVCYKNSADSCAKYGRLYNWNTAMNGASSPPSNASVVRGICPVGWHIPSDAEWTALWNAVGEQAGEKLKSKSGWNSGGNGTDEFGFSALPGGYRNSDGSFHNAGDGGYWWISAQDMYWALDSVYWINFDEGILFSVRCVQG